MRLLHRLFKNVCKPRKSSVIRIPVLKVPPNAKVTVCGTSFLARIISLDLKLSPMLNEIKIFDSNKQAVARLSEDLNKINSPTIVKPYSQPYHLKCAFMESDVIVLAGGYFGLPGEDKHSVFKKNMASLLDLAYECAYHNPAASLVVLTPPGTRNVPMISELYSRIGVKDSGRIVAPMYHYEMIATKLIAEAVGLPNNVVSMPVAGGCSDDTVVPLLSHAHPQNKFSEEEANKIIEELRTSNEKVCTLLRGKPPSLAYALAATQLILDVIRSKYGMYQQPRPVFARSDTLLNVKYLGMPVTFEPDGVKKSSLPKLSDIEFQHLSQGVFHLQNDARLAESAAVGKWEELDEDTVPGAQT